MDEIRGPDGKVVGRCAVRPLHHFFPKANPGTGVVKGLLAGDVPGITGVIFVKPQTDLARQDAIPDISISELTNWAQGQKQLLIDHQAIDEDISAQLAGFGVTHSGMVLGKLGGHPFSYEEFVIEVSHLSKILVHDGEVEYEEDDEVLPRDFNGNFGPNEALLEIGLAQVPDWLNEIADEATDRSTWSRDYVLNRALADAWGKHEGSKEKQVVVGTVNGRDIWRECTVMRPLRDNRKDSNLA